MGKGDKRGKVRPEKPVLPTLAKIPDRKERGRARMREIEAETTRPVIEARLRRSAVMTPEEIKATRKAITAACRVKAPDDRSNTLKAIEKQVTRVRMDHAANQLHESDMGRCIISIIGKDDRQAVVETWTELNSAWHNYCTRYLGRPTGPQGANITMVPDKVETDPSLRIDLRSPEEKDAAAKKGWDRWSAKIGALPSPMHRWAIRGALQGFTGDETLWRDREPTASGRVAVAALKLLTG